MAAAGVNGPLAPHMRPCAPRRRVQWMADNPQASRYIFWGCWGCVWLSNCPFVPAMMYCHSIGVFWGPTDSLNLGTPFKTTRCLFVSGFSIPGPAPPPQLSQRTVPPPRMRNGTPTYVWYYGSCAHQKKCQQNDSKAGWVWIQTCSNLCMIWIFIFQCFATSSFT